MTLPERRWREWLEAQRKACAFERKIVRDMCHGKDPRPFEVVKVCVIGHAEEVFRRRDVSIHGIRQFT